MADFYVSISESNVGVKEGAFFIEQGGTREPWGKHWQKVDACCLYDARRQGIALRREKHPTSHRTLGESGNMRDVWPEGYEGCCA